MLKGDDRGVRRGSKVLACRLHGGLATSSLPCSGAQKRFGGSHGAFWLVLSHCVCCCLSVVIGGRRWHTTFTQKDQTFGFFSQNSPLCPRFVVIVEHGVAGRRLVYIMFSFHFQIQTLFKIIIEIFWSIKQIISLLLNKRLLVNQNLFRCERHQIRYQFWLSKQQRRLCSPNW